MLTYKKNLATIIVKNSIYTSKEIDETIQSILEKCREFEFIPFYKFIELLESATHCEVEVAEIDEDIVKDNEYGYLCYCLDDYCYSISSVREPEGSKNIIVLYSPTMKRLDDAKKTSSFDVVSNPSHYCEGRQYEPRKIIADWGLNFNLGNAVKYLSRAGRKGNKVEDLRKAIQYIEFEIEEEENKNE